ncbi:hypothetical protein GAY31_00205 [Azospirillum brasilense]|nr:hypothetical protein [Azospirillum brasilense]
MLLPPAELRSDYRYGRAAEVAFVLTQRVWHKGKPRLLLRTNGLAVSTGWPQRLKRCLTMDPGNCRRWKTG